MEYIIKYATYMEGHSGEPSSQINAKDQEFSTHEENSNIEESTDSSNAENISDPHDTDTIQAEENIEAEKSSETILSRQIEEAGAFLLVASLTAAHEIPQEERDNDPAKRRLYQTAQLISNGYTDQSYLIKGENPLLFTVNGQQGEVQRIAGGEEHFLSCDIKMPDGTVINQEIPRKDIAFAYLIAEKDTISTLFSEDEQKIFQVYVDIIQNGEAIAQSLPEDFQETVDSLTATYKERVELIAAENPQAQEMLNLLSDNKIEELIPQLTDDPEESKRLKDLLTSENAGLAGLLLLMLIVGTLSAVTPNK